MEPWMSLILVILVLSICVVLFGPLLGTAVGIMLSGAYMSYEIYRMECEKEEQRYGSLPLSVKPRTNIPASLCSSSPSPTAISNAQNPIMQCNREAALAQTGNLTYWNEKEKSVNNPLPSTCSTDLPYCPLEVNWEMKFQGCPSTYLDATGCKLYNKYDRIWVKDLNPLWEQRTTQLGAKWNPYEHFNGRQGWNQFLAKDIVNRKDSYMTPLASIKESKCFGALKQGIPPQEPRVHYRNPTLSRARI